MGSAVSSGFDNDDLINNLLDAACIRTPTVERAFRAVDRADYFLPHARSNAYKDLAWKSGHLHISAPCIYSEVMERLCLEPGLSFLNLGSGTGYLSTMVGLILGSNGINHGVEIHEDVIEYAVKKLEDFKKFSGAIDEYDFCEPKFTQGNCLCLMSDQQYDRVYCGAACPEAFINYMRNLLRVNGILVMPFNDQLLQVKRTSAVSWDVNAILSVSFSTLIIPTEGKQESVELFDIEPQTLQSLCRSKIRNILRGVVNAENPNLKTNTNSSKHTKNGTKPRRGVLVPFFEDSDSSTDDAANICIRSPAVAQLVMPNRRANRNDNVNNILDMVMDHFVYRRPNEQPNEGSNNEISENVTVEKENNREENVSERQDIGYLLPSESDSEPEPASESGQEVTEEHANVAISAMNTIQEVMVDVLQELEEFQREAEYRLNNLTEEERNKSQSSATSETNVNENNNAASAENTNENPSASNSEVNQPKQRTNSEKIDSGLGEDIIEKDTSISSESSDHDQMELDTSSSSTDGQTRRNKRLSKQANLRSGKCRRFRTNVSRLYSISSTDSDHMEEETETNGPIVVSSPYSVHMRNKIQQLPLPTILKKYLNYYRDF